MRRIAAARLRHIPWTCKVTASNLAGEISLHVHGKSLKLVKMNSRSVVSEFVNGWRRGGKERNYKNKSNLASSQLNLHFDWKRCYTELHLSNLKWPVTCWGTSNIKEFFDPLVKCEIRPPVFLGYLQCLMTFLKELLLSLVSPGPAPHCMLVSITGCPWPVMCTERRIENSPTPTLHDNKHKNRKSPQNSCTPFSVCKFSNNENSIMQDAEVVNTERNNAVLSDYITFINHAECEAWCLSDQELFYSFKVNLTKTTVLYYTLW